MQRAERLLNHVQLNATGGLSLASIGVSGTHPTGILSGRVAIITGSGQGIGEAAAKLFAKEGAKVVVTDLDKKKSDAVAEAIRSSGGDAISIPGDVTDPNFPKTIIKGTIDKYGKLHILVNNAGYTWDGVIQRMSDKQWQAMLDVHNTAPFRLIREAAPFMREAGKAEMETTGKAEDRSIINISSTSGLHGNFGQANYATAKMGIVGLTKTVAKEWGLFGVRCNSLAFGMIKTRLTAEKAGTFIEVPNETKGGKVEKIALGIPKRSAQEEQLAMSMIPLRRAGDPEEAAGAILILASPFSTYITGHTLEATGGAGI